jgi:phenylalanyl-tRNA synthetase beta chain
LTREIDLIEEVARVHGYDKIPEDTAVPMCPSHRRNEDRVLSRVRSVLNAAGFDEAMTASVVPASWSSAGSPWTAGPPLVTQTPMLKGADHLRVSLIPSLLEARRANEAAGNAECELFETASVYLARNDGLPAEQATLGLVSGADFLFVRGALEAVVEELDIRQTWDVQSTNWSLIDPVAGCELRLGGQLFGVLGQVAPASVKQFGLKSSVVVAEINLGLLNQFAQLVPRYVPPSPYPAIVRDLNLIVDERLRWSELAATVTGAGASFLEELRYLETYRNPQRDGVGKKRVLFSFTLRSNERTLTNEEADRVRDEIIAACGTRHGAKML